ncbi:MAG: trehalase family glycosidase [Candidatus Thermoplasmatota archaeon]|nr:trehalase family glycosidase [Candidatus Thermoplasmatota archaeon]
MKTKTVVASFIVLAFLATSFSGCLGGKDSGTKDGNGLENAVWVNVPGGASFTGKPSYISEFKEQYRDNGGPVSDYGSHCGIKSNVQGMNFASILHYSCVTGADVVDYTQTGPFGVSNFFIGSGGKSILQNCEKRNVVFDYFGWNETANEAGINAEMSTFFIEKNVYLISVKVESSNTAKAAPALLFNSTAYQSSMEISENIAVLNYVVAMTAGYGQNWMAIAPSFEISKPSTSNPYSIEGKEQEISAGDSNWFYFVFAYSPDSKDDAIALAKDGMAKVGGNPTGAYNSAEQEWNHFFESLPNPHVSNPTYGDVYKMAATGLKMALYAPRNQMSYYGCVPSKIHYNWFWLWDTGFQALGYSEMDPDIGEQVIQTTFGSQMPDGYIPHMTNDQLMVMTPHSQSPVFGFSALKISEQDPDKSRALAFEKEMYEKGEMFIQWWDTERDMGRDGLFEFLSQDEGGWDNSPRKDYYAGQLGGVSVPYVGSMGEVLNSFANPLDCVDLNAWMYFYFKAMAQWAMDLGDGNNNIYWEGRAAELANKVDDVMWDEASGCWFDSMSSTLGYTHEFVKVLTPAIWFPAFAGMSKNETRIRTVIEKHLLNPQEFFGEYPIPTVAYNDPYFETKTPGWRGFIWLVTTYSALEALYKYGYESEASELKERTLKLMAEQDGMQGIWETYDPITGKYKNENSTGGYCTFQFGWSCAFLMELALERYQRERFVMGGTTEINGHVKSAKLFGSGEAFYSVETGGYEVPLVSIESLDAKPLAESAKMKISFSDPYGNVAAGGFEFYINGERFSAEISNSYILENGKLERV